MVREFGKWCLRMILVLALPVVLFLSSTGDVSAQSLGGRSDGAGFNGRAGSISRTNLALGLGLGAAALVSRQYENDRYMQRMLDASSFDRLIDLGDAWAAGTTMGLASAGMLALGHATGNEKLTLASRDFASSLIVTTAAVWSLKISVNARRPNGGKYSFPSGHTAAAFCVAPVLAKHFGPLAGVPAYALAGFAGLGRMEDRKHYLADVFVGAAIGLVVGREIASQDGLNWVPAPSSLGLGVGIRF